MRNKEPLLRSLELATAENGAAGCREEFSGWRSADLEEGFDIAAKQNGHYCWVCGRHRANEKFSGKGHSKHICKECMRKGHKPVPVPDEAPAEPHRVQYYKKRIRSNMILFVEGNCLFLFLYEGRYYATNPEKDESIFQFKKNSEPPFVETREFADSRNFHEALWEKYSARLDNVNWLDPEEYLACFEGGEESFQAISRKQRVFLDVVVAIGRGDFS